MEKVYVLAMNGAEVEDIEIFLSEEAAKAYLQHLSQTLQSFHTDHFRVEEFILSDKGGYRPSYRGFFLNTNASDVLEFVSYNNS
jgi:hypothetical protein